MKRLIIAALLLFPSVSWAQQAPSTIPLPTLTPGDLPAYVAILLGDRLELQKDNDQLRLRLSQARALQTAMEKRDQALADYWKRWIGRDGKH